MVYTWDNYQTEQNNMVYTWGNYQTEQNNDY